MKNALKKLLTLAIILPAMIIATACNSQTEFEITLVEIKANGEIANEISLSTDEGYLDISVVINGGGKLSGNKLNITWEFVGDDLGCTVCVIDPCCTGGRIAIVDPGDQSGNVVLRVTAQSKNKLSSDLNIKITETETVQPEGTI